MIPQPLASSLVRLLTLGIMLSWSLASTAAPPAPKQSPVSPAESLQYFQLPDDLRIELVAAEPEVMDPIDMRFDEQGRMYVVEMRDYPHGPEQGAAPLSRIKLLEDRDGDGRYETAHLFADRLLFATGVQPWRGGVIVTMAGRVAFLKDTDGDHRADLDETWFTGFAEQNSQLRANHPRLGPDQHIYIANGLRGGKIVDARRQGNAPIDISGRDFRFDPRNGTAEAITGVGQYGLCFDDFGHRFVCQNRNPVQHVVFEDGDLKTNSHYTPPAVVNDVAPFAERSKLYPLTKTWTTSNLHENTFTAACGVNIYRGTALPRGYYGLAFTCDPTGNLVHAERMEPWGPTFKSQPLYEAKEFLASTDEWFRPVAIENGPDGALYVVDMYRAVIEHPDFVPDELKNRPDQRLGDDRGRIYRIVAKESAPTKVELPSNSAQQHVQLLAHANAWQRETAQRLLIESGDKSIAPALRNLLEHDQPLAVFHALWTLQGLDLLEPAHLATVAKRNDSRLACVAAKLYAATQQTDAALREQIASGGEGREAIAGMWLALAPLSQHELANRAAHVAARESDPWSRYEVLLAAGKPVAPTFKATLRYVDERSPGVPGYQSQEHFCTFVRELGRLVGAIDDAATVTETLVFLNQCWTTDANSEFVTYGGLGLAEGASTRGQRLDQFATNDAARSLLARLASAAIGRAERADATAEARATALELLRHLDTPECREALQKLTHDGDQAVRIVAVRAVLGRGDQAVSSELLGRARGESPAVKRAILEGLCNSPAGTTLVLDALAAEELKPADIDATLLPRLVNHGNARLRERAKKLLTPPVDPNRQETIENYLTNLLPATDTNPERARAGKRVFEKNCATCHRVGDVGVSVAPDISDSRTKTPQQLLLDILEPNRAVDGNYVAYVVVTTEGKTLSGVIAAETSQAITMKQPGGEAVVVPRDAIEEMVSTGRSFMPEGLDRTIPPREMADLVSYIKNWRYLDGRIPAGTPRTN
jgi:putative membrane-bound dehydrogenase-like protein